MVVLPAPFGPKNPNISPYSIENDIFLIISLFPRVFFRLVTSKTFNFTPPTIYSINNSRDKSLIL